MKMDETELVRTFDEIEDRLMRNVLNADIAAMRDGSARDLTVNAPDNRVHRQSDILELMKTRTGLQYSKAERHREAIVIREDVVVTMGYEVVVPTGNVPDSGKTINRRYLDVYHFEDGGWRLMARQATNISKE